MIEQHTTHLFKDRHAINLLKNVREKEARSLNSLLRQASMPSGAQVSGTWGTLTVHSQPSGQTRTWTVSGMLATCSDCGGLYSGPLRCYCFSQRDYCPVKKTHGRQP